MQVKKTYPEMQDGRSDAPLPPLVPGLPLIGSALRLTRDPLAYFTELYHEYGPIFRIRFMGREVTVLAGLEANRFLSSDAGEFFGSEELFGGFAEVMETEIFLVAMDGEPHRHYRKVMKRGYARSQMEAHVPRLISLVDDAVRAMPVDRSVSVLPWMQRIVTEQLGYVIANRPPGEYLGDLRLFLNYMLNVKTVRLWPEFMLLNPAYKRARSRVVELGREVIEEHRRTPADVPGRPDLIDDLLAATDENGQPYPEEALIAATTGPYLAGIDTVASSISFMIYALLKHPDVLAQARAEVDALFVDGIPPLNEMRKLNTLHSAAIETLRLYPVAPFTPRTALKSFSFGGYAVPEGSEVFFGNAITHMLPEFYPNPTQFDVTRYDSGGKGQAGAYAPFTLGPHLCLGAGIAEAQMILTVAALLRAVHLELDPPGFEVTIHATPLPNPGPEFRVKAVEKRL